MRRSPVSRIFAALLAIWFTYSFVSPPSDMANMVMGNGSSMNMAPMDMSAGTMADMSQSSADENAMHADTDQNGPQKSGAPECDHRECCSSAISPSMLTPESTLAWLPEHVIEQTLPPVGTNVLYSEGQVLLPFANGPPNTVIA